METKVCKNCDEPKNTSEFYKTNNGKSYESLCKKCRGAQTYAAKLRRKAEDPAAYKEYHNKVNKRFYSKPGVRRGENLYHLYRVRQDWYDGKLLEQGGVCAICGGGAKENRYLHIDHDHSHHDDRRRGCPNCLRGLLCEKCNRGIGSFDDDTGRLLSAVEYINKYKQVKEEL